MDTKGKMEAVTEIFRATNVTLSGSNGSREAIGLFDQIAKETENKFTIEDINQHYSWITTHSRYNMNSELAVLPIQVVGLIVALLSLFSEVIVMSAYLLWLYESLNPEADKLKNAALSAGI